MTSCPTPDISIMIKKTELKSLVQKLNKTPSVLDN